MEKRSEWKVRWYVIEVKMNGSIRLRDQIQRKTKRKGKISHFQTKWKKLLNFFLCFIHSVHCLIYFSFYRSDSLLLLSLFQHRTILKRRKENRLLFAWWYVKRLLCDTNSIITNWYCLLDSYKQMKYLVLKKKTTTATTTGKHTTTSYRKDVD